MPGPLRRSSAVTAAVALVLWSSCWDTVCFWPATTNAFSTPAVSTTTMRSGGFGRDPLHHHHDLRHQQTAKPSFGIPGRCIVDRTCSFGMKNPKLISSKRGVCELRMADNNNNDFNPTNSIMVEDTQKWGKRQKAWTEKAAEVVAAVEQSLMATTTTAVLVDEATANPQPPPEEQDQQLAGSVDNNYEPTPPDASFLMVTENQGDDGLTVPIDEPAQQDIVVTNEVEENAEGSSFDPSYLTMVDDAQLVEDEVYMRLAMDLATQNGGERSPSSAFPNPTVGAVLVDDTGVVIGMAHSDFKTEATRACLESAGMKITALSEWMVGLPNRQVVARSTLYITLEPSTRRRGTMTPPVTSLIRQAGVKRVIFGCPSPVPEKAYKGAEELHKAGIVVGTTPTLEAECKEIIADYAELCNSKLQQLARNHFAKSGRPMGFLHCSVVESDNMESFARNGNAFGTNFAGKKLGYRNFGSYGLAPPPDVLWIDTGSTDDDAATDSALETGDGSAGDEIYDVDFEEEGSQAIVGGTPIMPWYEQADAIVATFPRIDNGGPIAEVESIASRLNGLKWLARASVSLPAGVERILVLDATELRELPMSNEDGKIGSDVDIEAFWKSTQFRKRVLLRRGVHEAARAAAAVAAEVSKLAAQAAIVAADALELGDAVRAADSAMEYQKKAQAAYDQIQRDLDETQTLRRKLEEMGVVVEALEGGEPIDVMNHLGKRNGIYTVVWRAGCWGARGVQSIMRGAFQMVSAHLAVDAIGGQFWQLLIAENAIQEACGPRSQVKVLADDINLEYCDDPSVDADCALRVESGKPVRHVRVDCRIELVDNEKPAEIISAKTERMSWKSLNGQAPWFL